MSNEKSESEINLSNPQQQLDELEQRLRPKLLIAPVNMRDRLLAMIQREIEQAQQGQSGKIIAKRKQNAAHKLSSWIWHEKLSLEIKM